MVKILGAPMWTPADFIQWAVVVVSLLALWISYRAYQSSQRANSISAEALALAREAHEKDRGELTVRLIWNQFVVGPQYDSTKKYGRVNITNTGRRPVTIVGAMVFGCVDEAAKTQNGGLIFQETAAPITLQEGQVFPKPLVVDPIELRDHARASCPDFTWASVQVVVEDSAGNSYYSEQLPKEKWPQ